MSKKILIVDDEEAITSKMSEIAAREGHHPITASNGIEALEILKTDSIDMLLTDISMPKMNGADLIVLVVGQEYMREENAQKYFGGNFQEYESFVKSHKQLPIMMMSRDPNSRFALKIGASGFFPKSWDKSQPFDEEKFVEILRKYLPK